MVDARRALPAVPAALCCGVGATMMSLRRPEMPAVTLGIGGTVAVVALVGLYRELATWSERARRLLGYAAATTIGAITAALLVFAAFATGLCSLGGDTCTDAELARVRHLIVAAPTSFAGVVAAYAALDRATRPRRRAVP